MSPTSGDIDVSSSPSGASVYLNGEYQGETRASGPLYITGLSPGTTTLVMKKSGYRIIPPGGLPGRSRGNRTGIGSAYATPASPAIASAEIFSQPSGADVFINNAYKGITPLSLDNVTVDTSRTYNVEIQITGYNSYTRSPFRGSQFRAKCRDQCSPHPPCPANDCTPLSPLPVVTGFGIMGILSFVLKRRR